MLIVALCLGCCSGWSASDDGVPFILGVDEMTLLPRCHSAFCDSSTDRAIMAVLVGLS